MSELVRLSRNAVETHGRDLFSCALPQWRLLLELGRTFGWQPEGTTYELPTGSKLAAPALRDYEPGSPDDRKLVGARDAANWARALEQARQSDHLRSMIEGAGGPAVDSMIDLIDEFVEYAFGGAFVFAGERD